MYLTGGHSLIKVQCNLIDYNYILHYFLPQFNEVTSHNRDKKHTIYSMM